MKRQIQRAYDLFKTIKVSNQLPWWEWDVVANKVTVSPLKVEMIGYETSDFVDVGYQSFTELLHPEDYPRAMLAMREHLDGKADLYQIDYRIRKKSGEYTWYFDRGAIIKRTEEGAPLLLRGVVLDLGPELQKNSHDEAVVNAIRRRLPRKGSENPVVLCAECGKMKIGKNDWVEVGDNFQKGFPADISHSFCTGCIYKLYPDSAEKIIASIEDFEE